VSLHSGMTPAQRLKSWLTAHSGVARIVLGTRMAVFASIPHLKLIIVDEEHDPSYKSHEGARYSARDLAIYRGRLEDAKVLLGSATPSLESWYHSRPAAEGGRYMRLHMPSRVGSSADQPGGAATPTTGTLPLGATGRHEPPAQRLRDFPPPARCHPAAYQPRRAKHGVLEPARLRPGTELWRLRLEKQLPALQCLPGVSQD
jgi:hypothetical protein